MTRLHNRKYLMCSMNMDDIISFINDERLNETVEVFRFRPVDVESFHYIAGLYFMDLDKYLMKANDNKLVGYFTQFRRPK